MSLAEKSAFPLQTLEDFPFQDRLGAAGSTPGMNLREHFAGLAMQGLMVNQRYWGNSDLQLMSLRAVHAADELIAALEAKQGKV